MTDVLCPVVVGRDAELGALRGALDAAAEGAGGLVLLLGEAGIGKSRLVREAAAEARAGAAVAAGRAVPEGSSIPFRPWTEALLQALRDRDIPGDADLAPWLPALAAIVPGLARQASGYGGSEAGEARADDSPAVRGEALLRLLHRLAHPAALVVTLEDLHWADPDTLAVLEYLGDNLSSERVLCLASCRTGEPSGALDLLRRLRGRLAVTHLWLGRLADEEIAAMVRACVPGADDDIVARVKRTAEGVPFLVEEVLASPGVPSSFADTVRARMDGLRDDERLVLRTAAVLGRHLDWRLLPAATGQAPEAVSRALERGVDCQLLAVDGEVFRAIDALGRGVALLNSLPQQGPALYRGLWPLLLTAAGDQRAAAAMDEARRLGITVNRVNRGLLGYCEAILAGRRGERDRAADAARAADADLVHYSLWGDLARLLAAEPALADGWGQPRQWLEAARASFAAHGIGALAARCAELLDGPQPSRWTGLGITAREADVLVLVAGGLANKEIAAQLHLSPRTVEKHVESLLRKAGARSRTQLVAVAGPRHDGGGEPQHPQRRRAGVGRPARRHRIGQTT